jgi:Flp pilus assembly protein TadD
VIARWIDRLAIVAVAAALLSCAFHQIVAHDLWWQLAAGDWILEHGLPTVDPFSFGYPDRPWIEMRWLGFVAAAQLEDALGLNALILAKCALLALTLAALWLAMPNVPPWARALGLLVAVCLMLTRLRVRPELFTFLFLAGFLAVLERQRHGARPGWLAALPLMQVLWSNTHTLWIIGPAVVWTAWLAEALSARWPVLRRTFDDPLALIPVQRRRLLAAALATTAAGFVTPYLLSGQLVPVTLLEQLGVGSELRGVIGELSSPLASSGDALFFAPYVVAIVLSAGSFALPGASFAPLRVLAWVGALSFSFLSMRNVSLFGLVAGWVLALQLASWWRAHGRKAGPLQALLPPTIRFAVVVTSAALIAGALTDQLWHSRGWEQRFGSGVAPAVFPIEAMAFASEQALPRPVLASLADGGYLIYEGGEKSVYVDGRLEVYGAAGILESTRDYALPERLFAIVDRLGVDSVLIAFPLMRVALDAFEASADWSPVFYDAGRALYVRNRALSAERLRELAIDWRAPRRPRAAVPAALDPPDWAEGWAPRVPDARGEMGRGRLLLHVGALDAAESEFRAAFERAPANAEAYGYAGILAWARQDLSGGAQLLGQAPSGWLQRVDVLEMRVHLAQLRGHSAQVFDFAAIAIAAGSRKSTVRRSLFESAGALGLENRAAHVLQGALDGGAADALLLGDLGALARARGFCADALRHFAAALELAPQRASLWAASARCHEALGDREAALEAGARADALRAADAEPASGRRS